MGTTIKDGGGRGYEAKVSSDFRMLTRSVTETEEIDANERGDAYNINTGNITLSNDTDTPVLYVKNSNEEKELAVIGLVFGFGPSAGSTDGDMVEITVVRNPTGGTIISNAVDVDIVSNRNYGSSNSADILTYKGATGNTLTGGDDHIFAYSGVSGRTFLSINELIPKGSSMGVNIKPRPSNTAQTLYVAVICYLHTDE